MISQNVVKFAKDNNAATIKMEMLEGFGEDEKINLSCVTGRITSYKL